MPCLTLPLLRVSPPLVIDDTTDRVSSTDAASLSTRADTPAVSTRTAAQSFADTGTAGRLTHPAIRMVATTLTAHARTA